MVKKCNKSKKTICLGMIVKNESEVITRCLESTLPVIDCYLISDTGSNDNTIEIITEFFKKHNVPGEVVERPWKNFAYNRTEVMKLTKNKADYTLIVDADDKFDYDKGFTIKKLVHDMYHLKIVYGSMTYYRTQLVSNRLDWRWESVVHEYITADNIRSKGQLDGMFIVIGSGGARSKNPKKYEDDAKILEQAVIDEPDNLRYHFYLAQSYRDYGNFEKAIEVYRRRANMDGWSEEVYWSWYQVGKCQMANKEPFEVFSGSLLKAYHVRPQRLEALHELVRFCRLNKYFKIGYHLGMMGAESDYPSNDVLFVEHDTHHFKLMDETALCAHFCGEHEKACYLGEKLLRERQYPEHQKARLENNVRFFKKAIRKGGETKKVLLSILVRNKSAVLPMFLKCIQELDYDKKLITIFVHTNNNSDNSAELMKRWVRKWADKYNHIEFLEEDIEELRDDQTNPHEWTSERCKALGRIRNISLQKSLDYRCDYYFVVDCDNFILPHTLQSLISQQKPIIAPMLRAFPDSDDQYSNFFYSVDKRGYFKDHPNFYDIVNYKKKGVHKVPVVHCTYLINTKYVKQLSYTDGSGKHEFVIFCNSARENNIDQYIANDQTYGRLVHFSDDISHEESNDQFRHRQGELFRWFKNSAGVTS